MQPTDVHGVVGQAQSRLFMATAILSTGCQAGSAQLFYGHHIYPILLPTSTSGELSRPTRAHHEVYTILLQQRSERA